MKTLTTARIQKVTSALHAYSLILCKQYSARVRRQSMNIAVTGRLFSFRKNTGMPTLGTIKNALRFAAKVEAVRASDAFYAGGDFATEAEQAYAMAA